MSSKEELLDELAATTKARRELEQQVKTIIEQQKVLAKKLHAQGVSYYQMQEASGIRYTRFKEWVEHRGDSSTSGRAS